MKYFWYFTFPTHRSQWFFSVNNKNSKIYFPIHKRLPLLCVPLKQVVAGREGGQHWGRRWGLQYSG